MVVSDKAQQLSVESSEDARPITDSVQHLKSHMDQLKKQAGQKKKQCDQVQKFRVEFDKAMDHAILWLEQKEDILATCTAPEMEPDKVMGSLQKHNVSVYLLFYLLDLNGLFENSDDKVNKLH